MHQEHGNKTGDASPIDISKEFSLLDGTLKCRYFASPEEAGETVGYYKNGQLRFKYPLYKGAIHGTGMAWYETGQSLCEEEFRYGLRYGRQRAWYVGGALRSEARYVGGRRHGEYKEWYENGTMRLRCEYRYDTLRGTELRHGTSTKWYQDGKIESQVSYAFGMMHGMYRRWDETGKLVDNCIYVRGVRISGELHNHIIAGTLTAKHILRITNAAVRRICLEELGYGRFLSQIPHEVIDRDGEYELIKINWNKREEPIYLIKVKCPSTGAFYTLRVPPTVKAVKEAIAWTFHLEQKDYNPEAET